MYLLNFFLIKTMQKYGNVENFRHLNGKSYNCTYASRSGFSKLSVHGYPLDNYRFACVPPKIFSYF